MTQLAGISDTYGQRLHRLGIDTVRDLLLHFPRRHKDFSQVTPITFIQPGAETTVRARIIRINARWTSVRHMKLTEAVLSDDSGKLLTVVWFNQPYVAKALHAGQEIFVAGRVELDRGGLVMKNPEYERASDDPQHAARLVPIYPETAGLTSRWLRPKIRPLLPLADALEEFIPQEIRERRNLLPRAAAAPEAKP